MDSKGNSGEGEGGGGRLTPSSTTASSPVSTSSAGKPNSSSHRSKRKISMPWFRQSSFGLGLAKLRLPKQHTIAGTAADGAGGDFAGAGSNASSACSSRNSSSSKICVRTQYR